MAAPDKVLTWLKAHPDGLLSANVEQTGVDLVTGRRALSRLANDGTIRWVAEGVGSSYHRRRYYALEHAPEGAQWGKAKPAVKRPAVAPQDTKKPQVTKCPSGKDHRFTVETPEPFFSAMGPGRYL